MSAHTHDQLRRAALEIARVLQGARERNGDLQGARSRALWKDDEK